MRKCRKPMVMGRQLPCWPTVRSSRCGGSSSVRLWPHGKAASSECGHAGRTRCGRCCRSFGPGRSAAGRPGGGRGRSSPTRSQHTDRLSQLVPTDENADSTGSCGTTACGRGPTWLSCESMWWAKSTACCGARRPSLWCIPGDDRPTRRSRRCLSLAIAPHSRPTCLSAPGAEM